MMIRQLFTYLAIGFLVASPIFIMSDDSETPQETKDASPMEVISEKLNELAPAAGEKVEEVVKEAVEPKETLPIKTQFEHATEALTFYFQCKTKRSDVSLSTQEESKLFKNLLFIMSDYHKFIQGTGTGVPVDEALNMATMERLDIEKRTKENLMLGCDYKAFDDMPDKIMRTVNYEPPKPTVKRVIIDENGNQVEVEEEVTPSGPAIKPVIGGHAAPSQH